jgi:hypothetical protein
MGVLLDCRAQCLGGRHVREAMQLPVSANKNDAILFIFYVFRHSESQVKPGFTDIIQAQSADGLKWRTIMRQTGTQ